MQALKICSLILCLSIVLNAELAGSITWQSAVKDCSIEIQISSSEASLFQPIQLHVSFNYPQNYKLDTLALTKQLLWQSNPLSLQWMKGDEMQISKQEKEGKLIEDIMIKLVPISTGHLSLSFLNITFKPVKESSGSIHILTPVFEINVSEQPLLTEQNFAPLIPLEPQFPLYLTNQNRQKLYLNPARIIAEQERNVRLLREHTFPWVFLLTMMNLGLLIWIGLKLREHFQKKRRNDFPTISLQKHALNTLQKLKESPEWEKPPFVNLYLKLADFCIGHMEECFSKKVSSFSLDELKDFIENRPKASPQFKNNLLSFLTKAYYVKFANAQPSLQDCQEAYQISEGLTKIEF